MKEAARHLEETIRLVKPLFQSINEEAASAKPAPDKWSPKEIIGHLIDSAGNNQQKFVRCMEQDGTHFPNYEQNFWVRVQHYNTEQWTQLITVWESYNYHIAHMLKNIPTPTLQHTIYIGNSGSFRLEFIANDYVEHLKHHLQTLFPDAGFLVNNFKMIY